ncbi:MAG: hypothetical protein P9L94_06555 [Candidatus Hinthialibacter antarcticus]|nr:hypothetical protein [Candidatus Hinthialibacter antarcticus]
MKRTRFAIIWVSFWLSCYYFALIYYGLPIRYNPLLFGLFVILIAAVSEKYYKHLFWIHPKYRVKVRVQDQDGKLLNDAEVKCSLGIEGEKIDHGWLFHINQRVFPFNSSFSFHAFLPSTGQWGKINFTFKGDDEALLEIQLHKDETAAC